MVESKVPNEKFKVKLFSFEGQVTSLKKIRESCFVRAGRYSLFYKGKILENIETFPYTVKLFDIPFWKKWYNF